jgi:DNA mismatch repair protein MutS2
LVLIDEIMSGTDPTEGAALAIAILERLTSDGALTLVTTHKGDLKAFAQQTEGVLNGSLDFDPETLSPTFQFRVGIPGSSYAFPIAQKAGLPEPIINRAQEVRGSERVSLDNLMLELQEQLLRTTKENLQAEQERRKFQALQNQLEEKLKSASALEYKYKEKAIAEAEKILAQANQAVEQAVRIIKEGEASKEAIKSAHQTIENARASVPARRKRIRSAEKSAPGPITAGDRVRLQDGETAGTVIQNKDSQGRFLVQMGAFKIRAEEAKLIKLEPLKKEKQERVRVKYQLARENIAPEIDLRGLDSQEAATRLEKYLYQAANANFRRIDIIHGKGGGILRKVVSEILSKSDYVKSFRTGGWGEGDFGVTVAELEE